MRAMIVSSVAVLMGSITLVGPDKDAGAQAVQDFILENRTGYPIEEVYVARPNSKIWGRDILGEGFLENGTRKTVRFKPETNACQWDIQVKYDDGTVVEWATAFNLCTISRLVLYYDANSDTTSAEWE